MRTQQIDPSEFAEACRVRAEDFPSFVNDVMLLRQGLENKPFHDELDTDISQQFLTPIVVQPGEFIQTVVRNIGVVGTSGTIAHLITFDGYWE